MEPQKVATTSQDMQSEHVQRLKTLFPNLVHDGVVDFDLLKEFFGEEGALAEAKQERYGLSWKGKSDAFKAIRIPSTGALVPQPEESKNWDETENVFIEGDNLEVLKLLQRHYRGKIKMIYIDPPYNTGKDFIYTDNFTEGKSDYYERTGQSADGVMLTSNPETNGRFHSDWLTMMYPRLFLGRELLRDDGVIFVSIDDNEVANLRLIMDEIFGEENFVGTLIWRKKEGGGQADAYFVTEHEYVLTYVKSEQFQWQDEEVPVDEAEFNKEDENGKFTAVKLAKWGNTARREDRPKMYFPIKSPDGKNIYPIAPDGGDGRWRVGKKRMDMLVEKNLVFWQQKDSNWIPYEKIYFDGEEVKKIKERSILYDLATTADGTNELTDIFGKKDIFENPKPTELIKFFLRHTTDKDAIVLDFFGGSGTCTHAVMEQNAEDGGNRHIISVQIDAGVTDGSEARKSGHATIAQVSRERIRRAGEKIGTGDTGFKSFKLTNSHYRPWKTMDSNADSEELRTQMKLQIESPLVDGYQERNAVNEIALKEGFSLNASITTAEADGISYWCIAEGDKLTVVSLAPKLDAEALAAATGLTKQDTHTLVTLDSALTDTTKQNLARNYNLKTI